MLDDRKTGTRNGELWGRRAADWAAFQETTLAPVFDAVLDRTQVRSGTRYLDLGCGAGLAAAKAGARGARVVGLDAAQALLDVARSRNPAATFREGDFEELPFDDACFDVVTAFNAIQYAGTPRIALSEAGRVTVPDGMVAVVTWGEPAGMEAAQIVSALKPLLPPAPPGAPGPFALSDEKALRGLARAAGLCPLEVFDVDSPWTYRDEHAALAGLASSGVAARAIAVSGKQAVDDAHAAAIRPFVQTDGTVVVGAAFRVLLAQPTAGPQPAGWH
jgi:SAM-dependent methyltransferase